MVPATTRRHRHPRCPEASQAPQAPEARVVSTWLLASARFQGITTFPQRVPTVFHQWAHVVLLHRGLLPAGGAIQRKSFWKVAPLKHAQVLREGCAFANGVVVRIIVRNVVTHRLAWQVQGLAAIDVPTSGYVAATVTATAITPSMFINQTHHYHNYSPPDTSPHYNMQ